MPFQMAPPANFAAILAGQTVEGVPAPLLTKEADLRTARLKSAAEVLTVLPSAGETLHTMFLSRHDLTDVIECLLGKLGPSRLSVMTLSWNSRNATQILEWLDSGRVTTFSMLSSTYHHDNYEDQFEDLRTELEKRGSKLAHARCHAKVICLTPTQGERFVIFTSANMRANGNFEQLALACSAELCAWYETFILERVAAHAS